MLVLDRLRTFLDDHSLGSGDVSAERVGGGSSNITFELRRGSARFILRRPPRPPLPPSAHDMVREARLQIALRPLGVRVPRILAVCTHDDVLGVPFYVMEHIGGATITDRLPAPLDSDHANRRRVSEALIDALIEIHGVDAGAPALQSFHRPGNYLERQVRRFAQLWERNSTRNLRAVTEVGEWLATRIPEPMPSTVVHGDYRLGNILVESGSPARVAAVLDWEMGAIGDPRADLGYLTVTYSDSRSPGTVMELSPVTRSEGFLDRGELVERYAAHTLRPVDDLAWFEVLALWKSAVFLEAIYGRYLGGEMGENALARKLERGIPEIAEIAVALTQA